MRDAVSVPCRPLLAWSAAVLLTGVIAGLVALPPFVTDPVRSALYVAFSPVCHQLDGRSFHLHGTAFAVCHRCTGVLVGVFAGTLLWPVLRRAESVLVRHAPLLLTAALLPTGLDWALGAAGLWANSPLSRAGTGAVFGMMAGVYLARGIVNLRGVPPRTSAPSLDLSHPPPSP